MSNIRTPPLALPEKEIAAVIVVKVVVIASAFPHVVAFFFFKIFSFFSSFKRNLQAKSNKTFFAVKKLASFKEKHLQPSLIFATKAGDYKPIFKCALHVLCTYTRAKIFVIVKRTSLPKSFIAVVREKAES